MSGQLTESECRELLQATGKEQEAGLLELLQEMMEAEATAPQEETAPQSIDADTLKRAFDRVIAVAPARSSGRISPRLVVAAAAILILALGTSVYFLPLRKPTKEIVQTASVQTFKNNVAPGGNKAILTLSDGSQIVLDSATNGLLSNQGNSKILKLNSGQLAYEAASSFKRQASGEATYNSITTPRGGQYQLVLADGTKVWLNASSSLRYPVAFTGKERSVELTGEGYFEVKQNEAMPFKVKVNTMEVDVLGTHFNVNAYADESMVKTTLLEGAVKIKNSHSANILSPGQQAQLSKDGSLKIVSQVDMDEVIAWKDGYFQFNQSDLKSIMRQISRWYDVDIRYEGEIPERKFGGDIARTANISEVLNILKLSQVHFRIEGKTLVLMP
jgi:ferric-dicitrate binding protein FerR (iron transport regulator)